MGNILEAICNISDLQMHTVDDVEFSSNRATSVGDGLEKFVKDAFSNSFNANDILKKSNYRTVFSYQGNSSNPPDFMLRGGPAVEVKKKESANSDLQLNSSHPKRKLKIDSPFISRECRIAEEWEEKDFIYVIGTVLQRKLSTLWMVDGTLYAADEEIYLNVKNGISQKSRELDINFINTKEIGKVKAVDPLAITDLRIRGMWILKAPNKVFDYLEAVNPLADFQCIAVISQTMYDEMPNCSRDRIENKNDITIQDVEIYNPNNPSAIIPSKLIKYSKTLV